MSAAPHNGKIHSLLILESRDRQLQPLAARPFFKQDTGSQSQLHLALNFPVPTNILLRPNP
jgi:hypothetical protein